MSTSSRPARVAAALALGVLLIGPAAHAQSDLTNILDAQRDGSIQVLVRGHGPDRVHFTLTNHSPERLQILLPPGLVAAAATGQGFQSMGLGLPTDQPGRFAGLTHARADAEGFRSVPADAIPPSIAIAPAQTIEFTVPSVCLNFGLPTPTPRDQFVLLDVADYTPDPRAQKALRSLATLGTSHGVAQAVAWNVFNHISFQQLAKQANRELNPAELSVAARFVAALDASGDHPLVDPAYFRDGRILVRLNAEPSLAAETARLRRELSDQTLLGLPVQVVDELQDEQSLPSSLLIELTLAPGTRTGQTQARALVRHHSVLGGWTRLETLNFTIQGSPAVLDGRHVARSLDQAVARSFVSITPARKAPGLVTYRVVNRLPLTAHSLVIRAGRSDGAPVTSLTAVDIGPGRSSLITLPTPTAVLERVELSGL
ncbi:MAG: hypothetical protein KatS3mg108_3055 [Isosphaeraceae bacterium]|nr:MAG: hypothetical protein KatS3mg108_3055 [Isosphaeraceae bacterium]